MQIEEQGAGLHSLGDRAGVLEASANMPIRQTPPRKKTSKFTLRAALWLSVALLVAIVSWNVWLSQARRVVDVSAQTSASAIGAVHFAGPGEPPGQLRDLLLTKIRSAPSGSSVSIATYYFVDRPLAQALTAASDRGVQVTLVLERNPRHSGGNDPIIALLKSHGLRGGLTIRSSLPAVLHTKIYAFSGPRPVALVGSFNPSGGPTAGAALLRDIGDHDRGHNLLVEITSPGLVQVLTRYVDELASGQAGSRFSPTQNRVYRDRGTQLYFYPRLLPNPLDAEARRLGPGDALWAAASHLDSSFVPPLRDAARRGARVSLIVHDSARRVSPDAVQALRRAGVSVRRYAHPGGLPMHAKFLLIERGQQRISYFGSFNLNRSSRYLNDELLVRSQDPRLFATLRQRFAQIERDIREPSADPSRNNL